MVDKRETREELRDRLWKESAATHTPGPWFAGQADGRRDTSIYALTPKHKNPIFLARIYGEGVLCNDATACATRIADARLVAAAPELLAALERARDVARTENNTGGWERIEAMLEAIEPAIAKARGLS